MANIPRIGPIHIDGMPTEFYAIDVRHLAQYGATQEDAIAGYCEAESLQRRGHFVFTDTTYIVFGPKR